MINLTRTIIGLFLVSLPYFLYSQTKMLIIRNDGFTDSLSLSDVKVISFKMSSSFPQDLVKVSGGTYQMGSIPNVGAIEERPAHAVTLQAFFIDKTEITFGQWTEVRNWGLTHGYTDLASIRIPATATSSFPVTEVSWYDAIKWCNARSEKDGLEPAYYTNNLFSTVYRTLQNNLPPDAVKWTANGYRLPTEAEWEFAAKGGGRSEGFTFSGSNHVDDVAWYLSNAEAKSVAVSTKRANELGLYDMSGNAWEWCWDWYGSYGAAAQVDPKGPDSGTYRVLRGGSYTNLSDFCRVAFRYYFNPTVGNVFNGFRCVRN